MRRIVLVGISTILLASGVGSVAAALLLPSGPAAGLPATGSAETVRRFYAAANDVIATGDPAPLHAVVAPHFVDADPLPGVAPGRAGLEAYLLGLHAAEPETRLEIEDLIAAGDRAVARVGVRNDVGAVILGGSLVDPAPPWSAVESFRVAGGRVVERRGDTDELAVVRTLAEGSVTLAAPAPRVVTVERVTLAPGARWEPHPIGPRLLVFEAGALRVDLGHAASGSVMWQAVTLAEGEPIVVPAWDLLGATNTGAGAASLLAVTFSFPPATFPAVARQEPLPSGVTVQTLAGGLAAKVGVGSATVSLGRATLGRDAKFSLSSADGPILVAFDDGEADMTAWGTAWVRRGEDGMSAFTREATLAAGDGLLLEPDGLAALRSNSTEAVELLIVAVGQEAMPRSGSPIP